MTFFLMAFLIPLSAFSKQCWLPRKHIEILKEVYFKDQCDRFGEVLEGSTVSEVIKGRRHVKCVVELDFGRSGKHYGDVTSSNIVLKYRKNLPSYMVKNKNHSFDEVIDLDWFERASKDFNDCLGVNEYLFSNWMGGYIGGLISSWASRYTYREGGTLSKYVLHKCNTWFRGRKFHNKFKKRLGFCKSIYKKTSKDVDKIICNGSFPLSCPMMDFKPGSCHNCKKKKKSVWEN